GQRHATAAADLAAVRAFWRHQRHARERLVEVEMEEQPVEHGVGLAVLAAAGGVLPLHLGGFERREADLPADPIVGVVIAAIFEDAAADEDLLGNAVLRLVLSGRADN